MTTSAARRLEDLPTRQQFSKPTLTQFCPDGIPYQRRALRLVRKEFDYSIGNLEILLSGSYGSAKSVLLAHIAVTHCLLNPKARVAICRRSLPDLKATLFREILTHIESDLTEGIDYWVNHTRASIKFRNGSEIISAFWADRRYKRIRSLNLSGVLVEEGTENDERDKEAFDELNARLRRIPGIKENFFIVATNPDSPAHWLYDYFIAPNEGGKKHATRHVFYSLTEQNPYLDPIYIRGLRLNMDARRARRYLDGEWVELTKDQVYYAYDASLNYRGHKYELNEKYPLFLSWDFNIGVGKPLSMVIFQWIDGIFHFAGEIVIEGMRTEESCEELADRGWLDHYFPKLIVCGDASGKSRDTRNKRSDYDIILDFLQNYQIKGAKRDETAGHHTVEKWVPLANPPLRKRHNDTNAHFCSAADSAHYIRSSTGQVIAEVASRRAFVYVDAPTLHKGFRLVELKKGSGYIEDDSPKAPYQHVTTAAGYGIMACLTYGSISPQTTRIL